MTIRTSSFGGTGGIPKLSPDLTFPADINANDGTLTISGIDGSAGLTTALSLTGKWSIGMLRFNSLTAENVTIKLTVDGIVIWDATQSIPSTFFQLLGNVSTSSCREYISCNSSFLLEIQTATDTDCSLNYVARPIL